MSIVRISRVVVVALSVGFFATLLPAVARGVAWYPTGRAFTGTGTGLSIWRLGGPEVRCRTPAISGTTAASPSAVLTVTHRPADCTFLGVSATVTSSGTQDLQARTLDDGTVTSDMVFSISVPNVCSLTVSFDRADPGNVFELGSTGSLQIEYEFGGVVATGPFPTLCSGSPAGPFYFSALYPSTTPALTIT